MKHLLEPTARGTAARRSRRVAAAGGLAVVCVAGMTTPATAMSLAGQACVVNLSNGASACADTERAAFALGARNGATAVYNVVRLYKDINFGSYTLTYTMDRQCTTSKADIDVRSPYLTSYNMLDGASWNDAASSIKTFNNCDVNLFEHTSFGGKQTQYISYSSDLRTRSFNDLASSLLIS